MERQEIGSYVTWLEQKMSTRCRDSIEHPKSLKKRHPDVMVKRKKKSKTRNAYVNEIKSQIKSLG